MLNIVHISDTHGLHRNIIVPDGDVLVHSGDISNVGERSGVEDFVKWFVGQPHRYKIFIAGNHDICFDEKHPLNENKLEKALMGVNYFPIKKGWLMDLLSDLPDNVFYLENSGCEIEGVKFWGSPITPWFYGEHWVFNKHRGNEIMEEWNKIPMGTHVVITHGPVMYKCDYIPHQRHFAGCEDLYKRIAEVKPMLHLSGHIHEGYGWAYNADTEFFNGSVLDGGYHVTNEPWRINLDVDFKEVNVLNNKTPK
jgi:hypothetical protein